MPTVLGHVDWATLSNPLDDFDQLEFVRGPGAALYGAGAFNGVVNLRTKAPRESLGGRARYSIGELGTPDLVAPSLDERHLAFGGVRIDKYMTADRLLTFELAHLSSVVPAGHRGTSLGRLNPSFGPFSAGTPYAQGRFGGALRYRWVDSFQWLSGIYVGQVPSYDVLDFNGSYKLTTDVTAGADFANLPDNHHYEAFGGDLLGRRALGHLTYSW